MSQQEPPQRFQTLRVEQAADRTVVRLDRPERRNAIDAAMVEDLHRVSSQLEQDPKVLILTGTEVDGKGIFASGADIAQLRERRRDDVLRGVNSRLFTRIAELPLPVIAALDGYVLGGGAELAWAADFRLGTPGLKVGQPEVGLGIIAAAGAIHQIHEPAELLPAAHALADRILKSGPLALRITKRVFHMPREAHPHVDELAQAILFESDAKFDRMQAFLDRRPR